MNNATVGWSKGDITTARDSHPGGDPNSTAQGGLSHRSCRGCSLLVRSALATYTVDAHSYHAPKVAMHQANGTIGSGFVACQCQCKHSVASSMPFCEERLTSVHMRGWLSNYSTQCALPSCRTLQNLRWAIANRRRSAARRRSRSAVASRLSANPRFLPLSLPLLKRWGANQRPRRRGSFHASHP
jgi:hypothetical protein